MNKLTPVIASLLLFLSSCSLFNSVDTPNFKLIPYKSGDKWGYVDKDGKIIINPQFNAAELFVGGLALVKSNENKFGYISTDGKYIINPQYADANSFSEGLAPVVPENGSPQYIDKKGEVKFTLKQALHCGAFNNGLAAVQIGEKWGYIDKTGALKITPQFKYAQHFSNGMAAVVSTDEKDGMTWGFIDTEGKLVINYQFKGFQLLNFNDGLCVVSNTDDKYGFINKEGKYVINPQFDMAQGFENGFAAVKQGESWGYIDKDGKNVINPQFIYTQPFNSKVAAVAGTDKKFGYIGADGKYVINPQFDMATGFKNDIAFVVLGKKWGVIDKEGKYLINPQYDAINIDDVSYKAGTVESDYLDIDAITNIFTDKSDGNHFIGYSVASNYNEVKSRNKFLTVNDNNTTVHIDSVVPINKDALISGLAFDFNESLVSGKTPVYSTVTKHDFWKGDYQAQVVDHYDIVPNDAAHVHAVSIIVKVLSDKAEEKIDDLVAAIKDKLAKQGNMSDSSKDKHTVENDKMSVGVIKSEDDYGNKIIIAYAEFKEPVAN